MESLVSRCRLRAFQSIITSLFLIAVVIAVYWNWSDVYFSNMLSRTVEETKEEQPVVEPKCSVPGLESIEQYWAYFENLEVQCQNIKHFGVDDAKKYVCMDERYDIKPGNCTIFSFGVNNQWSFEDELEKFGCKIYAFDPTDEVGDHDRTPNIKFKAVGIANFKGEKKIGWAADPYENWKIHKVDRLENLVNELGLAGREIDYIKLDVELSEIDFLQDVLFNSLHVLKNVKQIAMEIHHGYYKGNLGPLSTHQIFWLYLQLLKCNNFKMMHDRNIGDWREVVWAQDKEWRANPPPVNV